MIPDKKEIDYSEITRFNIAWQTAVHQTSNGSRIKCAIPRNTENTKPPNAASTPDSKSTYPQMRPRNVLRRELHTWIRHDQIRQSVFPVWDELTCATLTSAPIWR
jgi:hypothetical protein